MKKGALTLITGCMFAGKTTKLIQLANQFKKENKQFQIYYPAIDHRYKQDQITSHNQIGFPSRPLSVGTKAINPKEFQVVIIDEIQFFEDFIIQAIQKLTKNGVEVIVSGLDKDFRGEPFSTTQQITKIANKIIHLTAICSVCQKFATFSQRVSASEKLVLIGGEETYQPRCKNCFIKP